MMKDERTIQDPRTTNTTVPASTHDDYAAIRRRAMRRTTYALDLCDDVGIIVEKKFTAIWNDIIKIPDDDIL